MMQAEYINSFNHNYIKAKVELEKTGKLRYQYQILTSKKLEGLLPVSMHVTNGETGLYYEISSKQSLSKWFLKTKIGKDWMEKFISSLQTALWSLEQYLLDNRNMLLSPEHIFQDMETDKIYFLFMPYHIEKDKVDMGGFLSFLVENVDEKEEDTVTIIYDIYSKWELMQEQFTIETFLHFWKQGTEKKIVETSVAEPEAVIPIGEEEEDIFVKKRDLGEFFFGKYKKAKVAESIDDFSVEQAEVVTEEKTTYVEIKREQAEKKLYGNGKQNRKVISLDKLPMVIGKKGEKVDVTLADSSISRMHARLTEEDGQIFLEDLNATNGTYKNGVRLKPYEKVEIDREDEIKLGKLEFTYR